MRLLKQESKWLCILLTGNALLMTSLCAVANDDVLAELPKVKGLPYSPEFEGAIVYEVLRSIERRYDTFLCREWHPESKSRETWVANKNLPTDAPPRKAWCISSPFSLTETTNLGDALKKFHDATENAFTNTLIDAQICLLPLDRNGQRIANALDRPISLSVENATVQEACEKLIDVYNNTYPESKITYQRSTDQVGAQMPESFTSKKVISMIVREKALRSVLCEVFEMAPLRLYYRYFPSGNLLIVGTNHKRPLQMLK